MCFRASRCVLRLLCRCCCAEGTKDPCVAWQCNTLFPDTPCVCVCALQVPGALAVPLLHRPARIALTTPLPPGTLRRMVITKDVYIMQVCVGGVHGASMGRAWGAWGVQGARRLA